MRNGGGRSRSGADAWSSGLCGQPAAAGGRRPGAAGAGSIGGRDGRNTPQTAGGRFPAPRARERPHAGAPMGDASCSNIVELTRACRRPGRSISGASSGATSNWRTRSSPRASPTTTTCWSASPPTSPPSTSSSAPCSSSAPWRSPTSRCRRKGCKIATARFRGGTTDERDVEQAKTILASTKATSPSSSSRSSRPRMRSRP